MQRQHYSHNKMDALRAKGCKRCPRCKRIKPFANFGNAKASKDGHASKCKPCALVHARNVRKARKGRDDPTASKRLTKFYRIEPSGCWMWTGGLAEGLPIFDYKGRSVAARVASCDIHGKAIPLGKSSFMSCRNRQCINPDHVGFGDRRDVGRHGRGNFCTLNAAKERCKQGHPLVDGMNIEWYLSGKLGIGRRCLTCYWANSPTSELMPNRRSDAVAKREGRLMMEVFAEIPARTPAHIRRAAEAELWTRWKLRTVKRPTLAKVTRAVLRELWDLESDRPGALPSLDVQGEDGSRWVDGIADDQESTDPMLILERRQEGEGLDGR